MLAAVLRARSSPQAIFATDYSLPVADALTSGLIGLPVAPDLPDAATEQIIATLGRALV